MAKLGSRYGGTARILVILAVLILIMVAIIAIPAWKAFNYKSECIACEQAMKSASDGLKFEYMDTFDEDSLRQARQTIDEVMPAREDICPTHGEVYLIKNEQGIYETVCGLHNSDAKRRTRLNAACAAGRLSEARKDILEKAKPGDPEPESISIRLNNKELKCTFVTEEVPIKRGTSTTKGYKGVVAFYGTDDDGEINYFLYADEDHCAVWRENDGWRGEAYEGM